MHLRKNKPIMLDSKELCMIQTALFDWKEPDWLREEKAVLLNALKALEYIDEKDKAEEQSEIGL